MRLTKSLFILCLFGFLACTGEKSDENEAASVDTLKKETSDAVEAAKDFTMAQKAQTEKNLKEEIERLEGELTEIRSKASTAKETIRRELNDRANTLEKDLQALKSDYQKLKDASGKAWVDLKSGMDSAVGELKNALKEAKSKFKRET